MKYILLALCLCACGSKAPVNELDAMSRDVIKSKEGIEITLKPIPEDKPVNSSSKD